ncbi:MAG: hypothetical protein WC868_08730 [Bacteroidales bacterium]
MKKLLTILFVATLLITFSRFIIISLSESGGGIQTVTANGVFHASVNNFSKKLFWGGLKYWNEFEIINSKTGKITKLSQQLDENEYFDWRTFGKIEWVNDSMEIKFIHNTSGETTAINFELNLKLK